MGSDQIWGRSSISRNRALAALGVLGVVVLILVFLSAGRAHAAVTQADVIQITTPDETPGMLESAGIGVFGSILGGLIGYLGAIRLELVTTKNKRYDELGVAVFDYTDSLRQELDAGDPFEKLKVRAQTDRAAGKVLRQADRIRNGMMNPVVASLVELRNNVRLIPSATDQAAYLLGHLPGLVDKFLAAIPEVNTKRAAA